MDCDIAREALSARLDGEDTGVDPGELDGHLAGCAGCAGWYRRVAMVDRLARVAPADEAGSDLAGTVLGQVRLPRSGRWRWPLAAALVTVAIAQLTIGMSGLFTSPWGMPAGMVTSQHMDHETAAFNVAFGVVLFLVGLNSRRAATQVPVLVSFVGVLAVVSVFDLADGAVEWGRLATHAPVVLGLVLTVALSRQPQAQPGPGRAAAHRPDVHGDRPASTSWTDSMPGRNATGRHRDRPPAARRNVA